MKISDIVLNGSAESQIEAFLARPSHAGLLAGPTGTGKTHIAVSLAAQLLNNTDPENYAYFRTVLPDEKGTIPIEQVRTLINFFRLKVPGVASIKRVAIIQDADAMGLEAQNALLKLLEEPPADSVLLLTSSQPQGLLSTIRSRVQLLQLGNPGTELLTQHFKELGYDATAISSALMRSGTNVAEASQLLKEGPNAADSMLNLVKQTLSGTSYDRLLLVDSLAKQKDMANAFVNSLATVAAASMESTVRKGATSMSRWQSVLQAAHTAQDALERSGNIKLVLTELMLAM